jgi:glutaredoxin-like protein NrdH
MYTKMYLEQNKTEYENVDIEENPGAFELLKHYGLTSLPVVVIDDEFDNPDKAWTGFQVDRLEALL